MKYWNVYSHDNNTICGVITGETDKIAKRKFLKLIKRTDYDDYTFHFCFIHNPDEQTYRLYQETIDFYKKPIEEQKRLKEELNKIYIFRPY